MNFQGIYLRTTAFFWILFMLSPAVSRAGGGRIPAYAEKGMVVSASQIASDVGAQVLKDGGNAVDAAVATAFALAVTHPSAGNIGGGGFMVYHGSDGRVSTFDFREKAPLAATRDMYLDKIEERPNHKGLLSVGVPGTVAGLYLAHQKSGRKSWSALLKPAVKLAQKGFPYTWKLNTDARKRLEIYRKYPSSARALLKNGRAVYQPGEIWRQPDLAQTLKRIAKHGRDGFYQGKTAQMLAGFMRENGGLITEADLAQYQAVQRRPIQGTYRGYDIYSMGPPSSGGIVLVEMLNILEGYPLKEMGHNSAAYLHVLTEAMRRGFADRARHLGDPDFNPHMPVARLISKAYARRLRADIHMQRASRSDSTEAAEGYESPETTHFVVVDADRNTVSLTYTLEQSYGCKIVAEGLGFLLNNEMGDFNAVPGLTNSRGRIGTLPNQIVPQKRMLSSMTPTIVAKSGRVLFAIGSPGGRSIINTVLQSILNMIDHDMNIAEAIEAGRIHHQWLPDITAFEKWGISPDTQKKYEQMGHQTHLRGYYQGRAMGIRIDPETNLLSGAADSRAADGGVAGY